ncbi:MAG: MBL fold metallo-hydrolase [Firmicutes bacterium]|nr:MBL fold metallo-hydrolase [Bacillota bacterium]
MDNLRVGNIEVIIGEKGGRFPFGNTLFIDDQVKVVVDPGAGLQKLAGLKQRSRVDLVLNTHYHLDHIAFNYLFDRSDIYASELESGCYRRLEEIALRYGFDEVYGSGWIPRWIARISDPGTPASPYSLQNRHEWVLSTARLDGVIRWGEELSFGSTEMEVVGAPGHTAGFCCLYFPHERAVYTGDIDLTDFGPWYVKDGDIDDFIASARKIADLPASTFITGHELGVLSREEFLPRLERYLRVIDERDRRILEVLDQPARLEEVVDRGLIYPRRYHIDDWIRAFEVIMTKKHLARLQEKKLVGCDQGYYVAL